MKTIVITGGPCSGKTSALAGLKTHFAEVGQAAVFVEEAGTDLILAGATPQSCGSMPAFQTKVVALQLAREADAHKQARALEENGAHTQVLVICDRGIADGAAYIGYNDYLDVLQEHGLVEHDVFPRYDAVFCLESTAQLEGSYTLQNNSARSESAEEAAALSKRTYDAWRAHPQFRTIKNEEHFHTKLEALIVGIEAFLAAQH